jgi:predicted O-methyltransferase YrrM
MDNLFDPSDPILRVPVPCTQSKKEIEDVVRFLQERNVKSIVEIGAFFGGTTYIWAKHLQPESFIVLDDYSGVDATPFPVEHFPFKPSREDLEALWKSWGVTEVLWGKSQDYMRVDEHTTDFLFIDGDHSYEGVKADFDRYAPLVKPGGFIGFHDIINYEGVPENNVEPFWKELKERYENCWEFFSEPDQKWMGIGIIQYPGNGLTF